MTQDPSSEMEGVPRSEVPPSLLADDLAGFWADLAGRLERNGDGWRGQLRLSSLGSQARGVLLNLVGTPGRRTVDAGALEVALAALGVGVDLSEALSALGAPVSSAPQQQRDDRARRADGRAAARELVASWPEPWAAAWIDEVIGAGVLAGFGRDEASDLVGSVRRVLDAIDRADSRSSVSRIDLAATVLGSAHALDPGTRLERASTRALGHLVAAASGGDLGAVDAGGPALPGAPWAQLGVPRRLGGGGAGAGGGGRPRRRGRRRRSGPDRRSVVTAGRAPQPGERGRADLEASPSRDRTPGACGSIE